MSNAANGNGVGEKLRQLLESLQPVRGLNAQHRLQLAKKAQLKDFAANERISSEQEYRWISYVVAGAVTVVENSTGTETVKARSERARTPLFEGSSARLLGVTRAPTRLIRFDRRLFEILSEEESQAEMTVEEVSLDEGEGDLFAEIYAAYGSGKLELPNLSHVAIKVRAAVEDPDVSAAKVAQIVRIDPALTARLINVANSAMFGGAKKVESVQDAVTRLGLGATKNLAISLATKQCFRANSPLIKQRMQELYNHSVHVSALSCAIGKRIRGFSAERALLAGLLHDIGVIPLLTFADENPHFAENPTGLEKAIEKLRGMVGGLVLQQWGFEGDLIAVAEGAESWWREQSLDPDYCDIVQLGQLHAYLGTPRSQSLPQIDAIPAYKKFDLGALGQSAGLEFIEEAKQEITEIQNLLRG